MDNAYCTDYHQSNSFSKLFLDYIDGKEELRQFYQFEPNINSLQAIIDGKSKEQINRKVLVEQLIKQYQNSSIALNSKVQDNINALLQENTYTITTGHQLALFTGEWYFIFKILTAIKMAEDAKLKYPNYNFVPVFWMASEDHDFEEINHIHLSGHKFEWKEKSGGPAGRIKVDQVEKVIESVEHFLGNRTYAKELIAKYRKAYQKGFNLSQATRILVNEIFANEGLVIIDADDVELKRIWTNTIQKELIEQKSYTASTHQTKALEKLNYPSQIFPREINLFYIQDDYRDRIISKENNFETNDGKHQFTKDSILEELKNHPERFSPNVVLRPVYQESILPNLCYIGGPGEIAYWLQLKTVFENYGVQYPLLSWRNSFIMLEKNDLEKWNTLGFEVNDFFKTVKNLEDEYVSKHQQEKIKLDEEELMLKNFIEQMKEKAMKVDENLKYSLKGTEQRILRMMERVEYKIWKAEKRKYKTALNQIAAIKEKYFPKGKLQERYDNFSLWYANCGTEGVQTIKKETEILSKSIKTLIF